MILEEYRATQIYLTLEAANQRAVHVYGKTGFVSSGEEDGDELTYAFNVKDEPGSKEPAR